MIPFIKYRVAICIEMLYVSSLVLFFFFGQDDLSIKKNVLLFNAYAITSA